MPGPIGPSPSSTPHNPFSSIYLIIRYNVHWDQPVPLKTNQWKSLPIKDFCLPSQRNPDWVALKWSPFIVLICSLQTPFLPLLLAEPGHLLSVLMLCCGLQFDKVVLEYLTFLRLIDFVGSVLPEDDWFNEVCQDTIERLSGKPKAVNGDRDLSSPTASVSAHSISSVRSHGSS